MRLHRIKHQEEGVLDHAEYWSGNDITLCGLALEGDEGWGATTNIEGSKVTCPDCVRAIMHCHQISLYALKPKSERRRRRAPRKAEAC